MTDEDLDKYSEELQVSIIYQHYLVLYTSLVAGDRVKQPEAYIPQLFQDWGTVMKQVDLVKNLNCHIRTFPTFHMKMGKILSVLREIIV